MNDLPRCVTKGQLETRLQLHRNTVTRLLADGRFPNAFLVNRQWRIPMGDIEAFIRINGAGRQQVGGRP